MQIKFEPLNFNFLWNEKERVFEGTDLNGFRIVMKELGNDMEFVIYRFKDVIYIGKIDTHHYAKMLLLNLGIIKYG